jgi:hypothetical protein
MTRSSAIIKDLKQDFPLGKVLHNGHFMFLILENTTKRRLRGLTKLNNNLLKKFYGGYEWY